MNAVEIERQRLNDAANADLMEAERLTRTSSEKLDKSTRARIDVLLASASQKRQQAAQIFSSEDALNRVNVAREDMGMSPVELPGNEQRSQREQRDALFAYIKHGEVRTYSGMNTATGSAGGFLIPADFQRELFAGIAQYSDLLNENSVRLIRTETGSPMTIPGFDLSTISSNIVGEGVDNPPASFVTITRNIVGGFTYRTSPIVASLAIEQDSFESIWSILSQAFAVGIARGAGSDLVNGSGSGAPQGLLTAAADSTVVSASSTGFTRDDLQSIYGAVNHAYRVSPKCAWVMADATYQNILKLKDTASRPLIDVTEDGERLFGKKVLIAPDMPTAAGSKAVVFGDLSQYVVRIAGNSLSVRRSFEAVGMAEQFSAMYTAYARIDANLIAPNGVKPVVFGTLHS